MADGHLNICKECVRQRMQESYYEDIDKSRAAERIRGKQRVHTEKEKRLARQRAYRAMHPERLKAQQRARRKIKKVRPCEFCGSHEYIQRHHPDYSQPLKIIWCCSVCHHAIHDGNMPLEDMLRVMRKNVA